MFAMSPSESQESAAASAPELGRRVGAGARPGEMAGKREREADGRVEVRAGDVPDGVDHRHDHEPERQGDADVTEGAGLLVNHDRPAAGEDQRERADRLGRERPRERRHPQALVGGGQ